MDKNEQYINDLHNLIIQKVCEIGNFTWVLRRKNVEIDKMNIQISKLRNEITNKSQLPLEIELTKEEKVMIVIIRLYNQLLTLDPDTESLRTNTNNVINGKSLEWVKEQIKSSDRYKRLNRT